MLNGVERSAFANASDDVWWAGGVGTGGATVVVVAGAERVVLVFATGTTEDLGALGTV